MITKKGMLQALDGLIAGASQIQGKFVRDFVPWTADFVSWMKAAESTVEAIFGSKSDSYEMFRAIHYQPPPGEQYPNELEAEKARIVWFNSGLSYAHNSLIGFRYSVERLTEGDQPRPNPAIFVSHGGRTRKHVDATVEFLEILGLQPIVVANLPNFNLSVNEKVMRYMGLCSAGIALATADDEAHATKERTRPNVENEIGMMQTSPNIGARIIYLKEPEVKFASNYQEKVWITFKKNRVQDVFTAIARELRAFGLIGFGR